MPPYGAVRKGGQKTRNRRTPRLTARRKHGTIEKNRKKKERKEEYRGIPAYRRGARFCIRRCLMNGKVHALGGAAAGLLTAGLMYGAGKVITVNPGTGFAGLGFGFAGAGLPLAAVAGGIAGGLFPDADKSGTTASGRAPLLHALISLFTGHRGSKEKKLLPNGCTHSLPAAVLAYYILYAGGIALFGFLPEYIASHSVPHGGSGPGDVLPLLAAAVFGIFRTFSELVSHAEPAVSLRPFCSGFFAGYVSHLVLDCITPCGCPLFWPFAGKSFSFAKLNGSRDGLPAALCIIAGTALLLRAGVF